MLIPVVGKRYRFRSDVSRFLTSKTYHGLEMTVDRVEKAGKGFRVYGYGPRPDGRQHSPGTLYNNEGDFGARFEPVDDPSEMIPEDWS